MFEMDHPPGAGNRFGVVGDDYVRGALSRDGGVDFALARFRDACWLCPAGGAGGDRAHRSARHAEAALREIGSSCRPSGGGSPLAI